MASPPHTPLGRMVPDGASGVEAVTSRCAYPPASALPRSSLWRLCRVQCEAAERALRDRTEKGESGRFLPRPVLGRIRERAAATRTTVGIAFVERERGHEKNDSEPKQDLSERRGNNALGHLRQRAEQ